MTADQQSEIDWTGSVPVSRRFDDPYYSLESGLDESRHVFLAGNRLPERFFPGFQIGELGFGTGLNCFVALKLWRDTGQMGKLCFTSFEAYPMSARDRALALDSFPEVAEVALPIVQALADGNTLVELDDLRLEIITGDANLTLPNWDGRADAWFLDGFAPAKNPELWHDTLLQAVATHTASDGTFATYTAAGKIRRTLDQAGFDVERTPGFARKRHMSVGRLRA